MINKNRIKMLKYKKMLEQKIMSQVFLYLLHSGVCMCPYVRISKRCWCCYVILDAD